MLVNARNVGLRAPSGSTPEELIQGCAMYASTDAMDAHYLRWSLLGPEEGERLGIRWSM